jgi:Na+/serine symporter
MARSADIPFKALVFLAALALGYGIWALAEQRELGALYWLVAGGLALKAASDWERSVAAR